MVKKVTFKPYSKMTAFGESNELLQLKYSDKFIIIKAMMDCCSQSYLVQFSEFPFKNIKNKIITKLLLISNEELKKIFSNIKLLKLQDHNQLYLYQIKFKSKDEFYFGLVNSSNGYYDGYIELYGKNLPKKKYNLLKLSSISSISFSKVMLHFFFPSKVLPENQCTHPQSLSPEFLYSFSFRTSFAKDLVCKIDNFFSTSSYECLPMAGVLPSTAMV